VVIAAGRGARVGRETCGKPNCETPVSSIEGLARAADYVSMSNFRTHRFPALVAVAAALMMGVAIGQAHNAQDQASGIVSVQGR
jgi:hypothetical protein